MVALWEGVVSERSQLEAYQFGKGPTVHWCGMWLYVVKRWVTVRDHQTGVNSLGYYIIIYVYWLFIGVIIWKCFNKRGCYGHFTPTKRRCGLIISGGEDIGLQ